MRDLGALAEAILGLILVCGILWDVFATILVPGPSRGGVGIALRVRQVGLPIARYLSRRRRGPGRRPGNGFAPLILILAFFSWMLLLVLGFGLMFDALASAFTPRLTGLDQALYLAGSSIVTLGVSEIDAHGGARWLILLAGMSGFGVITAVISFVSQLQAALHQRESFVLTLCGMAGAPPSGMTLLESYAALGMQNELGRFFLDWRDWSAAVLHSHVSHPVLVYYHSVDAESDWLQILEAILDAATLVMTLIEGDAAGPATLCHRSGSRAAAHLCRLFDLSPERDREREADVDAHELSARLAIAGYPTRAVDEQRVIQLRQLATDYAPRIRALAAHMGADEAAVPQPAGGVQRG